MTDTPAMPSDSPVTGRFRVVRALAGIAAVVVGLALVLYTTAVGHCSAFGGTCPSESPPLLDDDVFRLAVLGGVIAVVPPIWLRQPGWRRLGRALAIGLPVALLMGFVARGVVSG